MCSLASIVLASPKEWTSFHCVLCYTDLPSRTGSKTKGDIRSFLRTCDAVNRGNYCVEEVNFQRETCYSTCRKNNCNEGDGSPIARDNSTISDALDWPELFNFNADLNGCATTRVARALVMMAAIFVFLKWMCVDFKMFTVVLNAEVMCIPVCINIRSHQLRCVALKCFLSFLLEYQSVTIAHCPYLKLLLVIQHRGHSIAIMV